MEDNRKEHEAETLRQKVSNTLQKNFINLTKAERTALKELQKADKIKVHGFHKSCGFAIVTDDTAK